MSRLLLKFSAGDKNRAQDSLRGFTRVAEQAARAGGRILVDLMGRAQVRKKGPKDLVTEADTRSQQVIREILLNAFPNHEFVGEEDVEPADWDMGGGDIAGERDIGSSDQPLAASMEDAPRAPLRWVVDPLDGTANYVKGLPGFAVSIGLVRGRQVLAGVVLDPRLDECFVASLGGGAWLNGQPLRASDCRQLNEAMVVASFPPNVDHSHPDIPRFENLLVQCHSLRRLGSAALNLCYLAAGRLDAYWATSCKVWDVAAGVLIVSEAGGCVTNLAGGPFELAKPVFAASANRDLHSQFLTALQSAPSPVARGET